MNEPVPFYAMHPCGLCAERVGRDGVFVARGFEFCRRCAFRVKAVIEEAGV